MLCVCRKCTLIQSEGLCYAPSVLAIIILSNKTMEAQRTIALLSYASTIPLTSCRSRSGTCIQRMCTSAHAGMGWFAAKPCTSGIIVNHGNSWGKSKSADQHKFYKNENGIIILAKFKKVFLSPMHQNELYMVHCFYDINENM